ncbi:hypothetical protein NC653_031009 [Populus alba x Populus x berolinensis]|uniref:Uncharacterized protein n=1 Tax=Populus alba x Populus x berolinensis TaxID=444605 RepID=A0AAD6Q107_9ROSI|nr:hypothetical protein NC653_031009 [Populus alba x Populus x berolinensis]
MERHCTVAPVSFQVPVSHSPSLPDSFPLSPFPSNLRNHFPPIQSVLGETKRQKLSRYSVNMCLSPGYSTITWFAIGYFFEGGVVLHCFVFTYALFDLVYFGVADSAILHRQRSNKAFQDCTLVKFKYWETNISIPLAIGTIFGGSKAIDAKSLAWRFLLLFLGNAMVEAVVLATKVECE